MKQVDEWVKERPAVYALILVVSVLIGGLIGGLIWEPDLFKSMIYGVIFSPLEWLLLYLILKAKLAARQRREAGEPPYR